MAKRRIKVVKFGRCSVSIYKIPEYNEYQIQQSVDGKVIGGKAHGGAFESDQAAARGTAVAMIKELRRQHPGCRGGR